MRSSGAAIDWEGVGAAVEQLFGLHLQGRRLPDLKRALKGAASELGHAGMEACARRLLSGNLDAASLEVLASHLTIGETYFFRDEDAFAALSTRILPGLIAERRRAGDRTLRIWSAACCTGEEIYSVAIVLQQLLPDLADWQLTLLGTDVNPRFLRKAAEAVYGQWSFRGLSAELRARHFRPLTGDRHALSPAIRRMVTLAPLNLVDGTALAGMRNRGFDLILCRNVLMYFTPAQATKVVGALHGALHEDGWLAVAPCEASQTLFARFDTVHCEGAIFYRRGRPAPARPAAKAIAPSPAALARAGAAHPMRIRPAPAARRRMPQPVPPPRAAAPAVPANMTEAAAGTMAARARALADQRRMDEALAWCDRWIAAAKLDPAAHYLRGMILAEMGEVAEACAALERSLYLAPGGVMASLALANLERARGRGGHAMRHYRNILASLEGQPPEGGVEHAEGVTVRQLAALVRDLMAARESA